MKKNAYFDVIVVGGGHAGVEAAAASSRIGAKTAIITDNITKIFASFASGQYIKAAKIWVIIYLKK